MWVSVKIALLMTMGGNNMPLTLEQYLALKLKGVKAKQ